MLLAAVVAAVVIGGVVLGRRRSVAAAWGGELANVVTDLRWVERNLLPGMLAAATVAAFGRMWNDGRPRLVAADQQLYGLSDRAPGEDRVASIARLRAAIAGLTAAVDAEAGLGAEASPDALRQARAQVEVARVEFASALDEVEGVGGPPPVGAPPAVPPAAPGPPAAVPPPPVPEPPPPAEPPPAGPASSEPPPG